MLVANFLIFFAGGGLCADGIRMGQEQPDRFVCGLLIGVVAPLIVYMVVPGSFGEWLSTLIPAGGHWTFQRIAV